MRKKQLFKILLVMKLTFVFLILALLHLSAGEVQSQDPLLALTTEPKNLGEVINIIEEQSEFKVFYKNEQINLDHAISVEFEFATISELLTSALEGTDVDYKVLDKVIVLTPRTFISEKQESVISGNVTDGTNGEPLPGVNVTIKGTDRGSITDIEGKFSIQASSEDILVFSFIGYLTQEVTVGTNNSVEIALVTEITELDEVVVVGYGTMKRSDVTGSVVSVRDEDLTALPTSNAIEVLQGKVAGLDVTNTSGQAGSTLSFKIRGRRSFDAENDPLILVDGVIYSTGGNLDINPDGKNYSSDIDIHPNDIASIEVLKDASSTAIYGSRGANGVILITTKKGGDRQNISFNAYWGINKATEYPEFFFGEAYKEQQREAYRTTGQWQSPDDDETALAPLYLYDGNHNVKWTDMLIRNGMFQNYQISISGGNKKTKYLLSSSFSDEEGIIKMDGFRRYGVRLNLDHEICDWAAVGAFVTYSYTDQELRNDPIGRSAGVAPVGEPFLEDGSINPYPFGDGTVISPIIDEGPGVWKNERITKRFFNSTYLNFKITEGLNFKTSFSTDLKDRFEGKWADYFTLERAGSAKGSNYASTEQHDYTNLLWENLLSFNRDLSKHGFQVVLGNTVGWSTVEYYFSEGSNFPINTFLWYNMYAAQNDVTISSQFRKEQLVSFFGRLHYKFMNRYIFQFTLRADGSSRLAPGNQWALFPSGSFAWRVNQESFMQNIDVISDLKLRISYGTSGNSAVDPYQTQGRFGRSNYSWQNELAAGYWPKTISNYDLGWETTASFNLGFDIGLFKNRLNLYFDAYQQKTTDLLLYRTLPRTTGYAGLTENIGDSENKGIELAIGTINVNTPSGFTWSTDLTFFANWNKIVRLVETDRIINEQDRRDAVVWAVGHPIDVFWSWKKLGIWQSSDSLLALSYGYRPGDIRLEDLNNDGKITEDDKLILGHRDPKWSGGINNTFSYKGVELSFFIYARMGQMISFSGYNWGIGSRNYTGGSAGVVVDYWSYSNPTNNFPRPDAGGTFAEKNEPLKYVDGSFVKIRDLTLAYTLPGSLTQKIRINRIRVYTTMKNWFILYSAIPGYDTERGGSLAYPLTRQWLFGINVEF